MEKFTIVIEKDEKGLCGNNINYRPFLVRGESEQEIIDKLRFKVEEWLKKDPRRKEWLKEFNIIKDNIKLRYIKSKPTTPSS